MCVYFPAAFIGILYGLVPYHIRRLLNSPILLLLRVLLIGNAAVAAGMVGCIPSTLLLEECLLIPPLASAWARRAKLLNPATDSNPGFQDELSKDTKYVP